MKTGELCSRSVVTAKTGDSVVEAAALMRRYHVGSVVVVDEMGRPAGMVTDRDIVMEVVAGGIDYRTVTAGDIMTSPVVTVNEEDDALATLKVMRARGIRRVPIVDARGVLTGVATLDDLLEVAGETFYDILGAISSERSLESWRRP